MTVRRGDWQGLATGVPAALVVAVCSGLPLLWMAGAIIFSSPAVRAEMHITSFRAALLGRTIGYNGLAALIATVMGVPAGFVLGRGRGFGARILWVVLPAALLMPSLSYTYGWSQLVRIFRVWCIAHFGEEFVHRWGLTFPPAGAADTLRCIWSLAAWLWAVPAGLIGLALRRLDTSVQQQAVLDGAPRRVALRQLAPAIIASLAIVTILASQEFAVYEPTGISVVATEVRMVFDTGAISSPDNPIAGPSLTGRGQNSSDQPGRAAAALATALPLLCATMILALLALWAGSRASAAESIAVGDWPRVLDASRWATLITWMLVLLNVAVPVWALLHSLQEPLDLGKIWDTFYPQITGTLQVASLAAGVGVVAAFSAAGRWTLGLLVLAGISFLVGGQLLAIANIRIYNRPWLFWAYDYFPVPVIAYLGRFGWLALAAGRGTWGRPWRELREIASLDGASTWHSSLDVVWPLAWPTLLAGSLLMGALSMTEVPATVLIFPQNPQVLTPTLMTWVHMVRYDPMIEASLLMMASVLVPALVALLLASYSRGSTVFESEARAQRELEKLPRT